MLKLIKRSLKTGSLLLLIAVLFFKCSEITFFLANKGSYFNVYLKISQNRIFGDPTNKYL